MSIWKSAGSIFALIVCSSMSALSIGQARSPEAFIKSYYEELQRGNWLSASNYYETRELENFKKSKLVGPPALMGEYYYNEKQDHQKNIKAVIEALPAEEYYAFFIKRTFRFAKVRGFNSKDQRIEILGVVKEGPSVSHVTVRTTNILNKKEIKGVEVLSVLHTGSGYKLLLPEKLKSIANQKNTAKSKDKTDVRKEACKDMSIGVLNIMVQLDAQDSLKKYIPCVKNINELGEWLIFLKSPPYEMTHGYSSPMNVAAYNNRLAIMKILVKKGAEIDKKDDLKLSPLMNAAEGNALAVVQYLLQRGADINYMTDCDKEKNCESGTSALSLAAIRGNYEIVKLLLMKTHKSNLVKSAIEMAAGARKDAIGSEKRELDKIVKLMEAHYRQ